MPLIGYARVSTEDQTPLPQSQALKSAGCAEIHEEQASGGNRARPVLARVLERIGKGDTLVVVRIDRLARSLSHLLEVIERLEAKGAFFRSLTDPIDTSSPQGKFTLQVLGAAAEFERALIRERTKAGIARARERGERGGRPVAMTPERIKKAEEMLAAGERGNTIWKAMQQIEGPKISRAAYYAWQQAWDVENRDPGVVGE
mgnify:CR=1 FL=1